MILMLERGRRPFGRKSRYGLTAYIPGKWRSMSDCGHNGAEKPNCGPTTLQREEAMNEPSIKLVYFRGDPKSIHTQSYIQLEFLQMLARHFLLAPALVPTESMRGLRPYSDRYPIAPIEEIVRCSSPLIGDTFFKSGVHRSDFPIAFKNEQRGAMALPCCDYNVVGERPLVEGNDLFSSVGRG